MCMYLRWRNDKKGSAQQFISAEAGALYLYHYTHSYAASRRQARWKGRCKRHSGSAGVGGFHGACWGEGGMIRLASTVFAAMETDMPTKQRRK